LRAKIAPNGTVEAITHDQATPDMIIENMAGEAGMTAFGADFISAGHGASVLYNTANRSATIWHNKLPLPVGIWRSVGIFANTFAIESFINELAHKLGKDPIALRLSMVSGSEKIYTRYANALKTLAEKSAWNSPKAPGTGRGMAMANDRKTVAAAAVEVTVTDGVIRVHKVTSVLDVGIAVNPEGIRMQIEGCVMMGISASLYEGLQVKDGQIGASNFHEYPLAMLRDAPEIQSFILEGDDVPYGVGEPPIAPIAPAIAAAVFDATGVMPRSLPLKVA
jgi:isoquinoline 1-oxidoreductase beta subunit